MRPRDVPLEKPSRLFLSVLQSPGLLACALNLSVYGGRHRKKRQRLPVSNLTVPSIPTGRSSKQKQQQQSGTLSNKSRGRYTRAGNSLDVTVKHNQLGFSVALVFKRPLYVSILRLSSCFFLCGPI